MGVARGLGVRKSAKTTVDEDEEGERRWEQMREDQHQ